MTASMSARLRPPPSPDSQSHMQQHFLEMNCAADDIYIPVNQFSSTVGLGNERKLKSRLLLLSLICICCQRVFCFWFHYLPPLSKCWYMDSLTRHMGSFHILFLESCPLPIDRKISLISLARDAISVQSDSNTRLILLPDTGLLWFSLITMYIYHALINALSPHMIHINLNIIFYTHVEHSPTKQFT